MYGFRPLLGAYFFIITDYENDWNYDVLFPSPSRDLVFYATLKNRMRALIVSVPFLGLIF